MGRLWMAHWENCPTRNMNMNVNMNMNTNTNMNMNTNEYELFLRRRDGTEKRGGFPNHASAAPDTTPNDAAAGGTQIPKRTCGAAYQTSTVCPASRSAHSRRSSAAVFPLVACPPLRHDTLQNRPGASSTGGGEGSKRRGRCNVSNRCR